eukprot:2653345-Prymnesium_polylepis.1
MEPNDHCSNRCAGRGTLSAPQSGLRRFRRPWASAHSSHPSFQLACLSRCTVLRGSRHASLR